MLASFLISVIYLAVCVLLFFHLEQHRDCKMPKILLWALIAAAVGIRIYFALQDYYFPTNVNNFKAWASAANSHGWRNVYHTGMFLDYPPGYIYILSLLDSIVKLFGLDYYSVWATAIFKAPAIITDFALAALLYRFGCEKDFAKAKAAFVAFMFLFMPAVVLNSSVWGQIESFYLFFVLLSFYFAEKDKTVPAAAAFAYALITKPQAVMFGPVLMFWIVKKKSAKQLFKALGLGILFFYFMAVPFCRTPLDIGWLAEKYVNTINGYGYYTVNGYNLYCILNLNWAPLAEGGIMSIVNPAVVALSVVLCGYIILKDKDFRGFYSGAAVIICLIFCLCTMMHERYIWPCFVLCLFAYFATGRKGFLAFGAAFGCLNYLNTCWVLAMYAGPFYPSRTPALMVSAAICLLTAAFVLWTVSPIKKEYKKENAMSLKKSINPNIVVAVITVVYAFFALLRLGSTQAPQTFYQSTEEDFSFRVHFDQPVQLGSIYVYSGLGDEFAEPAGRKVCGEFEVFTSADDGSYQYLWNISEQSVYTWKEYRADVTASSVLVQAVYPGSVLGEIVFTDTDGNIVTGTLDKIESSNPYSADFALDETDTKPADTGYYGSMYFDEIYHGRTAYEQLEGYSIYETTHPPLGKILISLGIKLFGMVPFGWRIVGALCGIIMVPLIYLLAVAVTKNSWCGVVASALMACDFMHFTQTRIATVDTYVVLFMLLTFLFMAYYHNEAFGSRKEWLYLLLSGAFMGCCVASKWNGAYPMVGLALFFFVSLFFKFRSSEKTKADKIYIVKTLLFCLAAFVALPAAIYSASFIPVINAQSFADYMDQLWRYQLHMFNYHANLEAEHFFSSMWYTWPFSIKPIWYAISENGNMVSTVSAFGNPIIWVLTPFASLYCLVRGIKDKASGHLFVALGYLASYLPWVMVSRLCFIYHYFPCAVFGIVAMAIAVADIVKSRPKFKNAVWIYIGLCVVLFVVFLPVTSGMSAPKEYIEALEIMSQWYFVN